MNGLNRCIIFLVGLTLLNIAGCSSTQQQNNPVKETSYCSSGRCFPANQKFSTEQINDKVQKLIARNEGQNISICTADKNSHTCAKKKVCYLVWGGLLPGNGCSKNLVFSEIENDTSADQLNMQTIMPLSFIGTKVSCGKAGTTLKITSVNQIKIELRPYHCSWMLMGQMSASFNFFVDMIDLEKGQLGGYWYHSVKGTGNGSGSGYALLLFPEKGITLKSPKMKKSI